MFRLQHAFKLHKTATSSFFRRAASSKLPSDTGSNAASSGGEADVRATVPSSADAVVIGGGAVGCSTLYHLSKLGLKNSVLVEKNDLTAGTTWHTAGLLWRLRPDETEMLLCDVTRQLLDGLEQETGVHSGFHMNGGLFMASTDVRLDEYRRLQTFGKYMGVESHILSPKECKDLYPLLNNSDLTGALYSPTDGHIDPAGYCNALTRGAKNFGAQVMIQCPVTSIETYIDEVGRKKVKAVHTEKGTIQTENVVVCGGCWTPYILNSVGVTIPQFSMRHSYVITERMEGVIGKPSIRDHDLSIYLKVQGDVLHIGGYEPNPVILDEGVEKDFAFGLYELDWDAFGCHIERAIERVPEVGETGIKSTVSGPESFTPDGKPLIGPNGDIGGLYHAHGFNSGGVMMSGGAGQQLAQWVVNGQPQLDMFSFDVRRFNPRLVQDIRWQRERSHEFYSKHYAIDFHFDEPLSGRNVMKDVLHEELLNQGCFYQSKGGWERPGWYDLERVTPALEYDYYGSYGNTARDPYPYYEQLTKDYTFDYPKQHSTIQEECLNARTNANVFNMSYFGKFYLHGADASQAVQWIFSNDLDKKPGSTVYTCMLNSLAGVESDLTVSVVEDDGPQRALGVPAGRSYYVAVGGVFSPYVLSMIRREIAANNWKCDITDVSHDMVLLSCQGPSSRAILSDVSNADFSNEAFPFSTHQVVDVAGHSVRAMRLSFVGEMGWELHAPNSAALDVYRAVMKAGQRFGIRNSGYRAMDSLSLEKGYRMWHSDVRSDDSPLEADLAFTCKLKSGKDFLGREALEKRKAEGMRKRLVCFTLDQPVALHGLEAIYRNGEMAGYIRRSEYGFALQKQVAWGYIDRPAGGKLTKDYILNAEYQLERKGSLCDAQVHLKSPFDPKHNRLQGIYD